MATPVREQFDALSTPVSENSSRFYGRYRLHFDQAAPVAQTYFTVIPVRHGCQADILAAKQLADPFSLPISFLRNDRIAYQDDSKDASDIGFVVFEPWGLNFIDIRNFDWLIQQIAPYLHDAHFFAYSTGDDDDRWIHEYLVNDRRASATRWLWPESGLWSAMPAFYENRIADEPSPNLAALTVTLLQERAMLAIQNCRRQPPFSQREAKSWELHSQLLARAARLK
jgi:hypothetical protein